MMRIGIGCLLASLLMTGCGADLAYRQARHLEEKGDVPRAVEAYERLVRRHPGDPRIPEACYRAGRLYAEALGRCPEAVRLYERAARAGGPFAEPARLGLITCPDYFPLRAGSKWTFVDTLSGGKNMRLEIEVTSSTGGVRGEIAGSYFAGKESFRPYRRGYAKEGWSVWQSADGDKVPILRYPFRAGRSWKIRREGRTIRYRVEADDLAVRTRGGRFSGCIKVRAHTAGYPSWVYEYYCPDIGLVKTTVGVPGAENPNTELAAYSVPETARVR
ncbi:MAG: tetratricopeptide repeat protein [Elusimicrobiota bacterium]